MSPIKGISDVIRLPRLGKIHLGIRREVGGTTYPEPTDYFVCPEEVKKVFGEKPRKLKIMFPTNDPEQWASQYLKCYSESRLLICKGDGMSALAGGNSVGKDKDLKEKPCNPSTCKAYQQEICRRVMNLQFLLPDCPGFGIYQLDTSSANSMKNINGSLKLIYNLCRRFAFIPLTLRLVEKELLLEGQSKTAWVLELSTIYTLAQTQRFARLPPEQSLVLPPPDSEAPDDLIPREVIKKNSQSQRSQEKEELIELWDRAKRQVWQLEMRDYQVAHYFMKSFHLEVELKDFNSALPPAKFNIENLAGFLKEIETHRGFY